MNVLLAYSGGLDTSFLVAWLTREQGLAVTTLSIDCGGWSDAERAELEARALATGAVRIDLETAVDNTVAQKLYESLGYQREQSFHKYSLALRP